MLASIFDITAEGWTINSLFNRDADVEIEDTPEEYETDDDEQENEQEDEPEDIKEYDSEEAEQSNTISRDRKASIHSAGPEIYNRGRENLSMNDCFS